MYIDDYIEDFTCKLNLKSKVRDICEEVIVEKSESK